MKPHKYAELIKAWADGAKIQFRAVPGEGEWEDEPRFLVWVDDAEYRIKPKDRLESLKDALKIQGQDGNWNYNPYMHGMYNGIEYSLAIIESREPIYRNAPSEWLIDKSAEVLK